MGDEVEDSIYICEKCGAEVRVVYRFGEDEAQWLCAACAEGREQ